MHEDWPTPCNVMTQPTLPYRIFWRLSAAGGIKCLAVPGDDAEVMAKAARPNCDDMDNKEHGPNRYCQSVAESDS